MDVFARSRARDVADQGLDGRIAEAEITSDRGVGMSEGVRGNILQPRPSHDPVHGARHAAIWPIATCGRQHKYAVLTTLSLGNYVECGLANWPHRGALFAVLETKAAAGGVNLGPFQVFDFPQAAAREDEQPDAV